jgi:hypothetical protein
LLLVSIQSRDDTRPIFERVHKIYPPYLGENATAGLPGLMLRSFRRGTPFQGEELVFDADAPNHFLARCPLPNERHFGNCLLERRINSAEIIFRFPRGWLTDWHSVASGVDKLIGSLHPADQPSSAILRRQLQ